ncbi:MAG: hypothetical protein ABRQ26_14030 [Syntrophomonadaceae bacterium]
MRSAIFEISLLIAAFIVGWLFFDWNSLFYIALGLIAFYAIVIIIYIVGKRSSMSWFDIFLGLVALAAWLAIAGVLMQKKGLHLLGLF